MYDNFEDSNPFEYEPNELENGIMTLVKSEVDKQVSNFMKDFEWYKNQYDEYNQKYIKLHYDHKELEEKIGQSNEFEVFRSMINENNVGVLVGVLNLKTIDIDFSGMNSECIPNWFSLICRYYPDKERVFAIMDLFNIKYPSWAKLFKLPSDYNEEELDLVFERLGKMYVCNGCIFSGNMGFFYREIAPYKGDLKTLLTRSSYSEIPWNLLLKNPLLATDKYINKIIQALKNKSSHSQYFFAIQDYQELTPEQVLPLFEYFPTTDNLWDVHKKFIDKNKNIIKVIPEISELFKHKINDNQYSSFYFANYPVDMQKDFIKSLTKKYSSKIDLINKMSLTKKEKINFLNEIADLLLDEDKVSNGADIDECY